MEFSIGIITFIYNLAIVQHGFGEIGLASYLVIGYLMLIIIRIFLGLAEGLQPLFSYFLGASKSRKRLSLCFFSTKVFRAAGIVSYFLVVSFSGHFYLLFNPDDSALVSFSQSKSLIYFISCIFAGYNIFMISYWQSIQLLRTAMLISLLRSVLLPPLFILILPAILSSNSIWFCLPASEAVTACVAFFLHQKSSENKSGQFLSRGTV